MKKLLAMLLALVMLLSLMAACGGNNEPAVDDNAGDDAQGESNGIILNYVGALGDFAFNDMAQVVTLELAEEYGYEQVLVEYGNDTAIALPSLLDALDGTDYDYVVLAGTYLTSGVIENSNSYPDTKFLMFDTGPDFEWDNPNLYGVAFGQNEGSFLAAVYEAAMTKSGIIGVLIRRDAPILNDFYTGWLHGARYAKNELGYDIEWVNAYMGEETVSGAYETTVAMLQSGTDIIYCVAGNLILGTTQAMEEKGGLDAGYMTLGVDMDQWEYFANPDLETDAPGYETIVTSMLKNVPSVVRYMFENCENGTLEPGNKFYGLALDGVGLADNEHYQEFSSDEAKQVVEDVKQAVIDGELEILSYYDFPTYDEFAKYRDDPTYEFTPAA